VVAELVGGREDVGETEDSDDDDGTVEEVGDCDCDATDVDWESAVEVVESATLELVISPVTDVAFASGVP